MICASGNASNATFAVSLVETRSRQRDVVPDAVDCDHCGDELLDHYPALWLEDSADVSHLRLDPADFVCFGMWFPVLSGKLAALSSAGI